MKIVLFGPSLGVVLAAALAGPVVAVQDEETELVEHWTPPGLPEGIACYIGQYRGRFLVYERTSGLKFPTQRCTWPQSHTDAGGHLTLGPAKYLNPDDAEGFASVAKAKRFYAETNPAFEAANPGCSTIRYLVEQLQQPAGMDTVAKGYATRARGYRDTRGQRVW